MTAWTTPRTWVTGEVLSSTNFNTHIRDNLAYYGGTDALTTTPPASPGNGQFWAYPVDIATTGIIWTFRYVTALSRWVFIGGGAWHKEVLIASWTPGVTYVALSTPVSFTVPRAGLYKLTVEQSCVAAAGHWFLVTPKKGAAAAADADSPNFRDVTTAGYEQVAGGQTRASEATLAASDVVQLMGRTEAAAIGVTAIVASLSVEPKYVT
jgi:hypothetical protein